MRDALTILTATPSSGAHELRDLLGEWVEAGLLAPLLWVDADSTAQPDGERVGAWLSDAGMQDVGVLQKVGAAPYRLLRLVAVQMIPPGESAPPQELGGTDMAALLNRTRAPNMRLVLTNLLVPTTALPHVDQAWMQPLWDANVVVSWEDRISSEHADQQVHPANNLIPHAALAAATISGAWVGAGVGPLDDRPPIVGAGRAHILVARSFARVIRAEGIAEELSFRLLGGATEARIFAAGASPARDPQRVAANAAEEFTAVDDGAIAFRERPPKAGPRPQVVTILTAFKMMFRYIWDRLRRAPHEFKLRVKDSLEGQLGQWAQNVTFGGESGYVARVGGRLRASDQEHRELPDDATRDSVHIAEAMLEQMGAADTPPPVPRVWEGLRRTAFGLVDAGPMPECVTPPADGNSREALDDLTMVVPEPISDALHLRTANIELRPCDPYQARSIREWLESELAAARAAEDEDRMEPLIRDLSALQDWVGCRSPSFVWRVGEALVDEVARARAAFDEVMIRVAAGPKHPDQHAVKKARRRLRLSWILWGLLLLGGIVAAAAGPTYLDLTAGAATAIGVTAALLWAVGSVIAFMKYQRQMFQIEHAADRSVHSYVEAVFSARHNAAELLRLSSMYDQFRDWGEIIGWVVHHPGGLEQGGRDGGAFRDERTAAAVRSPAALKVGVGEPSQDLLVGVTSRAARETFSAGWMMQLFERYRASSVAAVRQLTGLDDAAPDPDPDRDLAPPATRRVLLDHLATGRFSLEWRNELRAGIVGVLSELDPTALFATVQLEPEEEGVEAPREPVADFLAGLVPGAGSVDALSPSLWTPQARVERRNEVEETLLWMPEAFLQGGLAERVQRLDVGEPASADQPFALEAIRLDLSGSCAPEALEPMARAAGPWRERPRDKPDGKDAGERVDY
jgi:hypothetical protein